MTRDTNKMMNDEILLQYLQLYRRIVLYKREEEECDQRDVQDLFGGRVNGRIF